MSSRKHTSVVLTDDLKQKIEEEVMRTGEGASTVIRRVLEQYFRSDFAAVKCGRQIVINIPPTI